MTAFRKPRRIPRLITFVLGAALLALSGMAAPDADEKEEKWDVSHPPGDWQSITIDTEETTWSNVDVSPDGRTIVFDALGDI